MNFTNSAYVEFLWIVNQPLTANFQFVQTDFARASLVFFEVRCTLIDFIAKTLLKLKLSLRSYSFKKNNIQTNIHKFLFILEKWDKIKV